MTALLWDVVGERTYHTGVDRGVLYLKDGTVVPWNGITSVEESPDTELKAFYYDGAKFLQTLSPADYVGKLKAYTYPDEFELVNGVVQFSPGLAFYEQPPKSFSLSYRTKIGNDVDGIDHGYKIHILYNVVAKPDNYGYDTTKDSGVTPIEFGWSLTGTPVALAGARPLVHISIDSTTTPPDILLALEAILYGTEDSDPRLPTLGEVAIAFGYLGGLTIVDHGDGTWSAIDEGTEFTPAYITMTDPTVFSIDGAIIDIVDADTYDISTTAAGWDG